MMETQNLPATRNWIRADHFWLGGGFAFCNYNAEGPRPV